MYKLCKTPNSKHNFIYFFFILPTAKTPKNSSFTVIKILAFRLINQVVLALPKSEFILKVKKVFCFYKKKCLYAKLCLTRLYSGFVFTHIKLIGSLILLSERKGRTPEPLPKCVQWGLCDKMLINCFDSQYLICRSTCNDDLLTHQCVHQS